MILTPDDECRGGCSILAPLAGPFSHKLADPCIHALTPAVIMPPNLRLNSRSHFPTFSHFRRSTAKLSPKGKPRNPAPALTDGLDMFLKGSSRQPKTTESDFRSAARTARAATLDATELYAKSSISDAANSGHYLDPPAPGPRSHVLFPEQLTALESATYLSLTFIPKKTTKRTHFYCHFVIRRPMQPHALARYCILKCRPPQPPGLAAAGVFHADRSRHDGRDHVLPEPLLPGDPASSAGSTRQAHRVCRMRDNLPRAVSTGCQPRAAAGRGGAGGMHTSCPRAGSTARSSARGEANGRGRSPAAPGFSTEAPTFRTVLTCSPTCLSEPCRQPISSKEVPWQGRYPCQHRVSRRPVGRMRAEIGSEPADPSVWS